LQRRSAMPIRYWIDRDNGRLMTVADGEVTFRDITAHLDVEQESRDLDRAELIDARAASTNITADEVRSLVQRASDMLRTVQLGPTAIVTTNDVLFGMSRMYGIRAESLGIDAAAFRDMEAASRWLDRRSATTHHNKHKSGQ